MNDSLYNPDTMSKEEIKALFVARQPLLDELVSTIRNQPTGAGVQHLLIIAPRGMGKTTMLLMLQFAVEDNKDISKTWQAVRFPEESYDITELADFWLKVLDYLDDESLKSKIEEIEKRFSNGEDLREAAWALVKDWSKKNKKRIVLLVDNFDMILDQIGNDVEQARLRDILMNDGTVMLIGCAPSYFHQIQDYEQPLYNFFKTFNLNDLKFPDIEELLRRRAELDEIPNIEELLKKNRTRIKALETFTGGNPRLVLMLYRIITSSDMTEVRKGLEKLLDAVTPYYKDKTEKLPPQQRKIINEIAQYSLEKNEGISPTEIAQRMRTTPNQVSSQLKRLSENGYVRALNIRGRSSFYVLSEPLYAIWAQMRFGRNAREKRNWLVQILKALYDVQEIQKEIEKLDERVKELKTDGRENKARGVLEYMVCLLETHPSLMEKNFPLAIEGYLELKEIPSIKAELSDRRLFVLSNEIINKLTKLGIIDEATIQKANSDFSNELSNRFELFFDKIAKDLREKKYEEVYEKLDIVTSNLEELNEEVKSYLFLTIFLALIYYIKFIVLYRSNEINKANSEYEKSIKRLEKFKFTGEENENRVSLLSRLFKMGKINYLKDPNKKEPIILEMENLDTDLEHIIQEFDNSKEQEELINFEVLYHFNRTQMFLIKDDSRNAKKNWTQYISKLKKCEKESWLETASATLIELRKVISLSRIRWLILETEQNEDFSILIRAIDYLETKDESILEKLSPEVRIVVEETIKTLQGIEKEKTESESNKNDRASTKSLALSE